MTMPNPFVEMTMPNPFVEDAFDPQAYESESSTDLPWSMGVMGLCALMLLTFFM